MKRPLKIPPFKSESEEQAYWDKFDLSEYAEASDLVSASFPNLKPTSRSVSIRIPEYMLVHLKERANRVNIPYQSLIKLYLQKALDE